MFHLPPKSSVRSRSKVTGTEFGNCTYNLKILRTTCVAAVLKSYYNKCLVGRYNKRLIVRTLSFLGPLKMPHSTNTYFSPFMFLACNHLRRISELKLFMYKDAYIRQNESAFCRVPVARRYEPNFRVTNFYICRLIYRTVSATYSGRSPGSR